MFNTKEEIINAIADRVKDFEDKIVSIFFTFEVNTETYDAFCQTDKGNIQLQLDGKDKTMLKMLFVGKMKRIFKKEYPDRILSKLIVEIDIITKTLAVYYEVFTFGNDTEMILFT